MPGSAESRKSQMSDEFENKCASDLTIICTELINKCASELNLKKIKYLNTCSTTTQKPF